MKGKAKATFVIYLQFKVMNNNFLICVEHYIEAEIYNRIVLVFPNFDRQFNLSLCSEVGLPEE